MIIESLKDIPLYYYEKDILSKVLSSVIIGYNAIQAVESFMDEYFSNKF